MKYKSKLQRWVPSALAGLALSTTVAFGATNIIVNTYDDGGSVGSTWSWWGGATFAHDAAQDHTGNGGGSIYISKIAGSGDSIMIAETFARQGTWWMAWSYDLTTYTNLSLWVKWDTVNSTMEIDTFNSANAGGLGIILEDSGGWNDANRHGLGNVQIPQAASNGWARLNFPISSSLPGIGAIGAFSYNDWKATWGGNALFWVDDVEMQPSSVDVPPAPTNLVPVAVVSGLNCTMSTAGNGFWDRQHIMTRQNTGLSWIGNATALNPVTYAFTVKDFPIDPATYGCALNFAIAPNIGWIPQAPDWNGTNCTLVSMQLGADGAILRFQYKVDEPEQNQMFGGGTETKVVTGVSTNYFIYTNAPGSMPGGPVYEELFTGITNVYCESGNLGSVTNASPLGKWMIRFTSDTDVTLIAPDGAQSSFTIPSYNTSKLGPTDAGLNLYIGGQANNAASMNQAIVFADFAVSNTASAFYENFLAEDSLDTTNTWNTGVAGGPAGNLIVPASALYWLGWTLPASGYTLETAPVLDNPLAWTAPATTTIVPVVSGKQKQLITANDVSGNAAFFRMIKRAYSQVQVLLPGETNAPNTLTGKIGTPTPVSLGAGGLCTVTVNAVDATFHLVNVAGHNINLTTTDGTAILPLDAGLVNGTVQMTLQFGSTGSYTVTATDTTDAAILPGTSSAVTVDP